MMNQNYYKLTEEALLTMMSFEDEMESFRIVDEPNEPKIRVGDATIVTHYRDGTIEQE